MAISHFNNFLGGVIIRGLPILQLYPGKVIWVNNSSVPASGGTVGAAGNPGDYNRPLNSIANALLKCTAHRGDIIVVMPGHSETVSSAGGLALNVAGVAIVGLGNGSKRPLFTLDTATTASITVSAANISIINCVFSANFADIVTCFNVTTASDLYISDCYFKATAADMNFLNIIDTGTTDNSADGLTVRRSVWIEPDLATLGLVKLDSTAARVSLVENKLTLGVKNNTASLVACATGKFMTAADISDNSIYRLNTDTATGALFVTTDSSSHTGIFARNVAQMLDVAGELLLTASSGLGQFDNKTSSAITASGYVLPAIDS